MMPWVRIVGGGERRGWSCVKDKGMPTANGYVIYSFGFHCFQV